MLYSFSYILESIRHTVQHTRPDTVRIYYDNYHTVNQRILCDAGNFFMHFPKLLISFT